MTRLLLVRHGRPESTWGGAGSDPGLSDLGRRQAEEVAAQLNSLGSLRVVSSPMRRCLETAAPYAAQAGLAVAIEPRVSEIVASEGIEDRDAWLQERFPWRSQNPARVWATLEPRLHAWRSTMLDFARGVREDTVVFTHFIGINVMTGAALAREETVVCRPDHASITEIEVSAGDLRLVRLGDEMVLDDVR